MRSSHFQADIITETIQKIQNKFAFIVKSYKVTLEETRI